MKNQVVPVLLVICGAVLAGGISNAVHAEFNLDQLKGLAEQAKAYQERMKKDSQKSSSSNQPMRFPRFFVFQQVGFMLPVFPHAEH
jgi:hypothetical protein